jgi:hypothetical protein
MDYQTADSESVLKRPRPFGISDGVNNLPVNVLPVTYPGQSHAHATYSTDDLPKNVSRILSQGSAIKSMDFHPVQQTMLLGWFSPLKHASFFCFILVYARETCKTCIRQHNFHLLSTICLLYLGFTFVS